MSLYEDGAHFTDEQVARYKQRQVTPVELLAMDDHLAECDDCYVRCSREEEREERFGSVYRHFVSSVGEDPKHPSYEELSAHANGEGPPESRRQVDLHLESCSRCRDDVQNLLAFQAEMSTVPPSEHQPARESLFDRWFGQIGSRRRLRLVPALGLAACLVIAFFAGYRVPRSSPTVPAGLLERLESERIAALVARQENERLKTLLAQRSTGTGRPGDDELLKSLEDAAAGRIAIPDSIASLRSSGVVRAGSGELPVPLSPSATFVQDDRPVLKWSSAGGSSTYRVVVVDESLRSLASSKETRSTSWKVDSRLPRGVPLQWQVMTTRDGHELVSATARFQILDIKSADRVAQDATQFTSRPLVLGIAYARTGLLEDAEREFKRYRRDNPGSALVQQLLARIERARKGP